MLRHRLVYRAALVTLLGVLALLSQPERAKAAQMEDCVLCYHENSCVAAGWTHCEINCPNFNGFAVCFESEECERPLATLFCGADS